MTKRKFAWLLVFWLTMILGGGFIGVGLGGSCGADEHAAAITKERSRCDARIAHVQHTTEPCPSEEETARECAAQCWELLNSDLCRRPAEPDPFTPIGGWCAEADRWCALYGARSRSCSDARVRCRLYVRDAGPPQ